MIPIIIIIIIITFIKIMMKHNDVNYIILKMKFMRIMIGIHQSSAGRTRVSPGVLGPWGPGLQNPGKPQRNLVRDIYGGHALSRQIRYG